MTTRSAADTIARIGRRTLLSGLGVAALPSSAWSQAGATRGIMPNTEPSPTLAPPPARTSPPQRPYLTLGTGMHVGPIRAVAVSSDGTVVATGSLDKSIRLWRTKTGEELLRLYLPMGEGSIGVVDALAFSANYKRLYIAGIDWASPPGTSDGAVYVFDLTNGQLTGLMAWEPGFGVRLSTLSVSPDGSQIAMAAGSRGLIVRDTVRSGFEVRYADPRDPTSKTSAVAYSADGRQLVTVSTAGYIRLFAVAPDGDIRKLSSRMLPGGGAPDSVAFSPEGDRIAIGFGDRPVVLVLGLAPGAKPVMLTAPQGSSKGNLSEVAWCRDEAGRRWLVAGGTVVNTSGANLLVAWDNGAGPATAVPVSGDSVTQLVAHPSGGVVFGSSDPKWGRLLPSRPPRLASAQETERMDFRGIAGRSWGVARSGALVEFTARGTPGPVYQFDLNELTLTAVPSPGFDMSRPKPVPFNAQPPAALGLPRSAVMRSVDRAPDRDLMVTGTDDYLVASSLGGYGAKALEIATAAWGIALTRDGQFAVVAHGDGTIRWYACKPDRQLVEAGGLFVTADGQRWLAWHADGSFAHSERGGANLVGFLRNGRYEPGQLSKGGITGQWLDVSQLYGQLYNPDQVKRMLNPASPRAPLDTIEKIVLPAVSISTICPAQDRSPETRGIRAGKALGGEQPASATPGLDQPAACMAIDPSAIRAEDSIVMAPGTRAVLTRLRVDTTQPNTQVAAFVNGQNVGQVQARRTASRGIIGPLVVEHHVPLVPGENRIEFRAYGPDNRSFTRAPVVLTVTGDAGAEAPRPSKPRLRVLVAGIDKYQGTISPLRYAKADAVTFSRSVRDRTAPQYEIAPVIELFDGDASFDGVSRGLAAMAAEAEPQDSVVIYLSGHGVVGEEDRTYAFVTSDVTDADAAMRGGVGITADRLSRALAEIRAGRTFVFLDTCHAGGFDPRAIGYLNEDTGRYVLAASTKLAEAQDAFDGKNGLFAYALQQSLSGGAVSSDGIIDALDIGRFVTKRVEVLAQSRAMTQRAVFQAAGQITAFPLFSSSP